MAQFCLGVTSYNVEVVRQWKVVGFLFLVPESFERVSEHGLVKSERRQAGEKVRPVEVLDLFFGVRCKDFTHLFIFHNFSIAAIPQFELLISTHLVIVNI